MSKVLGEIGGIRPLNCRICGRVGEAVELGRQITELLAELGDGLGRGNCGTDVKKI